MDLGIVTLVTFVFYVIPYVTINVLDSIKGRGALDAAVYKTLKTLCYTAASVHSVANILILVPGLSSA